MSIFKAAMSPFFDLEPSEDKKPQVPVQPVQPVQPVPNLTPSPQVARVANVVLTTTEVDPKVHEFFQQLLVNKNGQGYDYFEHSHTIENLKTAILDPVTRVKTAVVLAQTMGSSKSILLESAQGYLKHLDESYAEFSKDHQAKMAELVAKDANLDTYNKKIQDLQEEIRKLEIAKNTESEENRKKKEELLVVKSKFDLSYGVFSGNIKSDINDINRYA